MNFLVHFPPLSLNKQLQISAIYRGGGGNKGEKFVKKKKSRENKKMRNESEDFSQAITKILNPDLHISKIMAPSGIFFFLRLTL